MLLDVSTTAAISSFPVHSFTAEGMTTYYLGDEAN